jgi:exonuclease VII small subunit
MERMNIKDYRDWYEDELNEKIKQLEEENKKLEDSNTILKKG